MKSFASDNNSGIHPDILNAITEVNQGHAMAYGNDDVTKEMESVFNDVFGTKTSVFPVPTGTAANILCLSCMTDSFNSVICADVSHVVVDECNALQKFSGCSFEKIAADDGKLTPELIDKHVNFVNDVHCPLPRVISITQATELGTIYTPEEVKALADYAHSRNLLLHMDGARLANAAASAGCTLAEMTSVCGVDALSFGGTKNGALTAEAAVFFRTELAANAARRRKQGMMLSSKMRFISAQFKALLSDGLWHTTASHSNKMATALASEIESIESLKIIHPVQANMMFVKFPAGALELARQKYFFHSALGDPDTGRLVTSFDTTMDDINDFVTELKRICV